MTAHNQQAAIVASLQDWAKANIQGRNRITGNVAGDTSTGSRVVPVGTPSSFADLGIDKKTSVPHSSTANGSHRWRSCALVFLEHQVRRLRARFAT